MNIVTEKEVNGRLQDGINTILNLNEEEFNKLIDMLTIEYGKVVENSIYLYYSTDECRNENNEIELGVNKRNKRGYIGGTSYNVKEFISELETYMQDLEKNSKEYVRCQEIIETRSFEALKRSFSGKNGERAELVNKLFRVLTDSNECDKFLDFERNSTHFEINGKQQKLEEYLKIFGDIFKYKNEEDSFDEIIFIEYNYNIPETVIETIDQNAMKIYDEYHEKYDRYIDKRYEFWALEPDEFGTIRKGNEPDWNISKELREAVYKDMPDDLSLEEKALYIYAKLCKELEYDEEYLYKGKGITSKFESDFSQEHLESIKPGSKITCFDFSRTFEKFVNELDGDIEAVTIYEGINRGHFLSGFYTDKASVRLEAININGEKDPTNDLMKAKNGIRLRGVQPVFDREQIIGDALNKVYSLIYGRDAQSIKGFVNEIKSIPREEVPNDVKLKLQSFIEIMQERGIRGNEFVQTFTGMCKSNFFGQDVEKAFIGRRVNKEGENHIQRMVLLRQKEENEDSHLYLIDTSSLEMVEPTERQIIDKINSNDIVYENDKYKIPGIDKEANDDTAK